MKLKVETDHYPRLTEWHLRQVLKWMNPLDLRASILSAFGPEGRLIQEQVSSQTTSKAPSALPYTLSRIQS
jgi:hypothetical protein